MKRLFILALLALTMATAQAKKHVIPVFITAGQSNTDGRTKNEFLPEYIKKNKYRHTYWCYNNGAYSEHGEFKLFWPYIDRKDASHRWAYKTLSKKGKFDIKALIWHQGESDRHDNKAYYENLKEMISYVRRHLVEKTGQKKYYKLPVILGGISHKSAGFSEGVEEGQRRLSEEDKNVYFIPVPEASLQSDNMHFDEHGAELLGKKIYNKLVELKLAGKGAKKI